MGNRARTRGSPRYIRPNWPSWGDVGFAIPDTFPFDWRGRLITTLTSSSNWSCASIYDDDLFIQTLAHCRHLWDMDLQATLDEEYRATRLPRCVWDHPNIPPPSPVLLGESDYSDYERVVRYDHVFASTEEMREVIEAQEETTRVIGSPQQSDDEPRPFLQFLLYQHLVEVLDRANPEPTPSTCDTNVPEDELDPDTLNELRTFLRPITALPPHVGASPNSGSTASDSGDSQGELGESSNRGRCRTPKPLAIPPTPQASPPQSREVYDSDLPPLYCVAPTSRTASTAHRRTATTLHHH